MRTNEEKKEILGSPVKVYRYRCRTVSDASDAALCYTNIVSAREDLMYADGCASRIAKPRGG
jgi:hypothetical protein